MQPGLDPGCVPCLKSAARPKGPPMPAATRFNRIQNYNVSVKELENRILFMRTLVKGGSNHSFGIHVAKLAGMPGAVIQRAQTVLKQLEKSHAGDLSAGVKQVAADTSVQLSFFQLDDPTLLAIKNELIGTDINHLTPLEALNKLSNIKKMLQGGQ
jgi:DNA mismatch repair protein MutS